MIGRTNAMNSAVDPDEVTARAADVLEGKNTINENGDVVGGLIPNHREGKECLKVGVFDEIGAFYMVFPEGFYKSYDTNSPRTWCSIYSLLDTVGVDRINNYLINKHNNRVVFNGATFDNILVSGVAVKSVNSETTKDMITGYLGDVKHYVRYVGIEPMGIRFDAVVGRHIQDPYARYGACFLNYSVDLSFFKTIRIGFIANSSGRSYSKWSPCSVGLNMFCLDVNKMKKLNENEYRYSQSFTSYDIIVSEFSDNKLTTIDGYNNGQQYYKDINVSDINHSCFIGFGIWGETASPSDTYGSLTVWINHIELIN